MRLHPGIRMAVKWGGLGTSLVILATALASMFCAVLWKGAGWRRLELGGGAISASSNRAAFSLQRAADGLEPDLDALGIWAFAGWQPLVWWPHAAWWPGSQRSAAQLTPVGPGWAITCPLWLPLLLVAAPTARLYWHDRRVARRGRDGCCPACGYDPGGTTDGVCSECGKATARTPKASGMTS